MSSSSHRPAFRPWTETYHGKILAATLDTGEISGTVLGMKTFELTSTGCYGRSNRSVVRAESAFEAVEAHELESRILGVSGLEGPRRCRVTDVREIRAPRASSWVQTGANYSELCSVNGVREIAQRESDRALAYQQDLPRYTAWLKKYYEGGGYSTPRTPTNVAFYMRCAYEERCEAGLVETDLAGA